MTSKKQLRLTNLRNEVSLYKELLDELKKKYRRNRRNYLHQISCLKTEADDYKNRLLSKERALQNLQDDYIILEMRYKQLLRDGWRKLGSNFETVRNKEWIEDLEAL